MHRADIDGLRAVAVVSVVLFHFKLFPNYIRGGFVGVDVFFVISGYLITGIILKGINDGSYSVASFYNRRIRRIFRPCLLFSDSAFSQVSSGTFLPRRQPLEPA